MISSNLRLNLKTNHLDKLIQLKSHYLLQEASSLNPILQIRKLLIVISQVSRINKMVKINKQEA